MKYWEDCVDPKDVKELWEEVEVTNEWLDARKDRKQIGQRSTDHDGKLFFTQTQMSVNHVHFICYMLHTHLQIIFLIRSIQSCSLFFLTFYCMFSGYRQYDPFEDISIRRLIRLESLI